MKHIREIEKEVDDYYLSSSYIKRPLQQAIFDLLRAFETANHLSTYVDVISGGTRSYDGTKRDLMDAINMALHWVYSKNEDIGQFSFGFEDTDCEQALMFLYKYALPYSKVCDAYVAFSRGRFEATVGGKDGKEIFFRSVGAQGIAFEEEMNEFFEKSSSLNEYAKKVGDVMTKNTDLIQDLISGIYFEEGRLCYEITEDIIGAFKKVADIRWDETSILPKNWEFSNFYLEDYRKCWSALFILSYIHSIICMNCKDALAYKDNVIVQKKDELISFICSYIKNEEDGDYNLEYKNLKGIVTSIIDLITFNPSQRHGDIMYQPIVVMNDWTFITPSLFINGVPERNLIALIQQLKEKDKKHFKEVNSLEKLMREQIEESISMREDRITLCHDIEIKENGKTKTDVDFGVYDEMTNSVLLCEMKWLLSADASTEVYAREDDVDHGCKQVEDAVGYAMINSQEFMKKAFDVEITEPVEFFCCVVTKADVRSNNRLVPVVSQRKLKELIESEKRYREIFEIIRNKEYYKPISEEIKYEDYVFGYAGYVFHVPAMIIPDEINRIKY